MSFKRRDYFLAGLLLLIVFGAPRVRAQQRAGAATGTSPGTTGTNTCPDCLGKPIPFIIKSYQGRSRCLDYTPEVSGSSVFLNDCALAHSVRVEEINDRHEVLLHAGTLVIGIYNPLENTVVAAPSPHPTKYALQLQHQANFIIPLAANQIFSLDGDSLFLVFNRRHALLLRPELPQRSVGGE